MTRLEGENTEEHKQQELESCETQDALTMTVTWLFRGRRGHVGRRCRPMRDGCDGIIETSLRHAVGMGGVSMYEIRSEPVSY